MNYNKALIEKYGLVINQIEATDYLPSFAYSIGLWQNYKQPEIICFGLSVELMHQVINDVAALIKNGQTIVAGEVNTKIFKDTRATFLPVDKRNMPDYFNPAISYYDTDDFPALQLVWTDKADLLPWETGFDKSLIYYQPLLDRNVDFKFREAPNLGVFTTRQWLEKQKPILRVLHETDGDWQFLTGDQLPEDGRQVALAILVKRDPTLNEVFNLDYGQYAERSSIGEKWQRRNLKDET